MNRPGKEPVSTALEEWDGGWGWVGRGVGRRRRCLSAGCMLDVPANMLVYLRDGPARTSVRAAILR